MQAQTNSTQNKKETSAEQNQKVVQQKKQTSPYQTKEGQKAAIQAKHRPVSSQHQPVQRKATKSAEIAQTMGTQYGVDTSGLQFNHNSSFPGKVNAEATIQGNKIDFAPGKDSEANIKHEIGHHIVNTQRGTPPKADSKVNGQAVNTSDEAAADKIMNAPLQRKVNSGIASEREANVAKASPIVQRTAVIQRLNAGEKQEKLRLLKDYIQITSPGELNEEFGKYPNNQDEYRELIIRKIKTNANGIYSLKAITTMQADLEDDDWTTPNGFNITTLRQAIQEVYKPNSLTLKNDQRKIGRTDAEFDKHDCVWAAVTYGLKLPNSIAEEKKVADGFSSLYGEVDDAILYRIMQKLGWEFKGQGNFANMFPDLQPGVAIPANIRGRYDGRYIISEDINAAGTQGHVLAVDVQDVADGNLDRSPLGFRRNVNLTDRQYGRQNGDKDRVALPNHTVYVWKVS